MTFVMQLLNIQQKTQRRVDMNTHVSYKGEVTITSKTGKLIRHNNGSNRLFEIFATFMTGGGYSMMSPPGYLMIYSLENTDKETILNSTHTVVRSYSILTSPVDIMREVKMSEGTPVAAFSVSLYRHNMVNGAYKDNHDYCVALMDSHQEYILAVSAIDRETVGIMASGGEVLIQWDMQLMNESEDE